MGPATAVSACLLLAVCGLAHVVQKRSPIQVFFNEQKAKGEQDLSKVPGQAGVDYPIFRSVPHTSFSCKQTPFQPGMYANVETGCQAYHVCHDGREGEQGASFLCPNGTLFNQHEFACDWWYNVNCADAPKLYELNLYEGKNPYFPKKPEEEAVHAVPHDVQPVHQQPFYYSHA